MLNPGPGDDLGPRYMLRSWSTQNRPVSFGRRRTVMKSAMSILQVDRPACFGWAPSAPLASAALKVREGFLSRKNIALGGTVRGPSK